MIHSNDCKMMGKEAVSLSLRYVSFLIMPAQYTNNRRVPSPVNCPQQLRHRRPNTQQANYTFFHAQ